mgnify:CR=1 FL=1
MAELNTSLPRALWDVFKCVVLGFVLFHVLTSLIYTAAEWLDDVNLATYTSQCQVVTECATLDTVDGQHVLAIFPINGDESYTVTLAPDPEGFNLPPDMVDTYFLNYDIITHDVDTVLPVSDRLTLTHVDIVSHYPSRSLTAKRQLQAQFTFKRRYRWWEGVFYDNWGRMKISLTFEVER